MRDSYRRTSILLRIGIAFAFLYAATESFLQPVTWIGYLPPFLQSQEILFAFSAVEIALALWLLWGKHIRYSSSFAALMLAGIIVFNFSIMDVVFRDVTILFAALALAMEG